jgi:large subunit ribosomal protein L14
MIQKGTKLKVVDNSGANQVQCIGMYYGYRRRYAYCGDLIMISVKSLSRKKKNSAKVKKGNTYLAIIIRTKSSILHKKSEEFKFFDNSVILLSSQKKMIGTRIFTALSYYFKTSKYLKLISISSGLI